MSETKTDLVGTDDRFTEYGYGPGNVRTEQTSKTVYQGLDNTGTLLETTTYAYNLQGRLETVEIDDDGSPGVDRTLTYQYNDDGIRVSSTDSATVGTTIYHVDPNNPTGYTQVLEEAVDADGNGRLDVTDDPTSYTLGHDVIAQQSYLTAGGDVLYFLYDGHGSTRALINNALTVAERYAYDAYGKVSTLLLRRLTSSMDHLPQTRTGPAATRAGFRVETNAAEAAPREISWAIVHQGESPVAPPATSTV